MVFSAESEGARLRPFILCFWRKWCNLCCRQCCPTRNIVWKLRSWIVSVEMLCCSADMIYQAKQSLKEKALLLVRGTPPLTLDTWSLWGGLRHPPNLPHRPSSERNENQLVEFHLWASLTFYLLVYSLVFILSFSPTSFRLRSEHKDYEAWPGGGEQPPEVG